MNRFAISLAATLLAPSGTLAQPTEVSTERKAEAYYYYCLARMHEMQMQAEEALENYGRSVEMDPTAAYPHVALAGLYQRTRQLERAIASATTAIKLDPELAAGHRILGNIYYAQLRSGGDADMASLAIQEFRETVRLDPTDVESRIHLARLLFANRMTEEAASHLEEIVRLEPRASYEMFMLAQIKRAEGDQARAIQLLKQSIAVDASQPEAHELLASLLADEQRFGEMVDMLEKALEEAPDNLELRLRLADALANDGRLEPAAAQFEEVLEIDATNAIALVGLAMIRREQKRLDEAESLLERAIVSAPGYVPAHYNLAGVYEEKRQYEDAIDHWNKLLLLPTQGPDANLRQAEYWAHVGFANGELGRDEESMDAFAKARELSGESERFELFYLQALVASEEPKEEVLSEIDEALKKYPGNSRLALLKARALDARGEGERALAMAMALSEEEPDNEVLSQGVVELLSNQGRYQDAERFLSKRLASAEETVGLLFQMGAVLERQHKFDGAETYFKKVLEKEPDSAPALNYLGYMLADRDVRLSESLEYIERALAQDPYNGAYLDSLGWVYFKMGELDLAEENLLKAIKSLRLTGVVYDHLGDLYHSKGDIAQALSYWRKALDQEDDELEKDEVARKIEQASTMR